MTPKVLVELGFTNLISEAKGQTQTGSELLTKYQSYLMASPESCGVINQFFKEAAQVRYDSVINNIFEQLADYISTNKTLWAIATACESIYANERSYNMLNRNAAKQAEKLLEMSEDDAVKYIRAGALKNVMFCEAFRNIAKQVYAGQEIIESTADYTKFTPISMVEYVGDGHCFVVAGQLYKLDENQNVQTCEWSDVSSTFKTVESLLESKFCSIDENSIIINYNNVKYVISESGKVTRNDKEMTTEQFRDNNRLVLMTANPRRRNEYAGVLEAIALISENYDKIATLDHVGIYSTKNDRFVVIEAGNNLYACSIASARMQPWAINEDAIKVCEFIKKQTNVQLSEAYADIIKNVVEEASEKDAEEMKATLENNQILSLKERIELLTEKFKNDPTKLAVLSKLATEVATV